MGRKEEFYALMGLLLAFVGVVVAILALPQIQPWFSAQLQNPLFLPLVAIAGFALLLLLALAYLLRDWIAARLRALRPGSRLETQYLVAIEQTLVKTPALLPGNDAALELLLTEAYCPLTLRPDRDDGLGDGVVQIDKAVEEEMFRAPRSRRVRLLDGSTIIERRLSGGREQRGLTGQLLYWGLWAGAQALVLALAAAGVLWLLGAWAPAWRLVWWRIALAIGLGALWLFLALRLHAWLVANNRPMSIGALDTFLHWLRQRGECIADPGTPGDEIWSHPRLLIRGAPGCGKTTLLRHIAMVCARQRRGRLRRSREETSVRGFYGWPVAPFPIYIPLRALDLSTRDTDLLSAYEQKLHLLFNRDLGACDKGFFAERLRRGGCLVLLDAFDELRDVETRTMVGRQIAALPPGPRARPNRFVVTSRIVGYEGQLDGDGFVRRRIEELDDGQAQRFIHTRYAAIAASERRTQAQEPSWSPTQQAENLIRRLPQNPGLRRLSRNPLLLALTVALHLNHRSRGLNLPEERYRLYEEALRLLVRDWERLKGSYANLEPTDDRSDLNLDERLRLLRELAWMMFELSADGADARAHAVVRASQARAKLAELLTLLPGFAAEKTGAARTLHANSESERWMQNIGQRGGVLQELGNVPGSNDVEIQFAHLTFQEYLAARAAASEDGEQRLARILERWDRPAWREVLLLYAASHDATPVVRHLLARPGPESTLLAGAVLLERPTNLSRDLQERSMERLRDLAFAPAGTDEQQALEALRQLEERKALPERAELLRAFEQACHGPVRARSLELALDRALIHPQRERNRPPGQALPRPQGAPSRPAPPSAAKPPATAAPLDPALTPTLLRAATGDPHYLVRLAAGYALAEADPRFADRGWIPELVHVPAGLCLIGSADDDEMAYSDEKPQHRLELPDFWIGTYPITVAQWRAFVADGGYRNRAFWTAAGWAFIQGHADWQSSYARLTSRRGTDQAGTALIWDGPPSGDDNLPVTEISWFEAVAYCRWLSARTGHTFRLPTEAEWEKAARGSDGRIWPWGDTWVEGRCNSAELGLGRASPVGSFPEGVSVYGAHDMASNVWEWCATKYGKRYPYQLEDEWAEAYLEEDTLRRLRGGSWYNDQQGVRRASRNSDYPRSRYGIIGLRVASHSPLPNPES